MNVIKYFKKPMLIACCSTFLLGTSVLAVNPSTANAQDTSNSNLTNETTLFSNEMSIHNEVYNFFLALEKLPYDIEIQGAKKSAEWLSAESGVEILVDEYDNFIFPSIQKEMSLLIDNTSSSETSLVLARASVGEVATCIGTAGLAALPFSKVTKLKTIFNALGGITRTVDMTYTNYKYHRALLNSVKNSLSKAIKDVVDKEKLASEANDLLKEIFGVTATVGACKPVIDDLFD
ncbi:hypothetical protein [Deinococcus persicinus]|uniref:hypothetical protein n=1 Tax=Lysinibacillus fusiformis TaxID=28031 RepID=UPI0031F8CCF8